jgi:hemoglobin-like flavoprotein
MDAFTSIDVDYLEQRKTLIRQTWRAVEFGMGHKVTTEFYDLLLSQNPDMGPFFSGMDMSLHSPKLYAIIKLCVGSLDDFESVVPILEDLGRRHGRIHGLKKSHYKAFTNTFIDVMRRFIHKHYCEMMAEMRYVVDVAGAWSFVLNLIGDIMANAAEEIPAAALQIPKKDPPLFHKTSNDSMFIA